MEKIDFQMEFEKVARRRGMGDAVGAGVVCHRARNVLEEIFPDGEGEVVSFKNGLLTMKFKSSGALARFDTVKDKFLNKLKGSLGANEVTEVRAVLR